MHVKAKVSLKKALVTTSIPRERTESTGRKSERKINTTKKLKESENKTKELHPGKPLYQKNTTIRRAWIKELELKLQVGEGEST